jgi:hypothetical protein
VMSDAGMEVMGASDATTSVNILKQVKFGL